MERKGRVPLIVEDHEFLVLLGEEAARSERYGHQFAVLLLQPPVASQPAVNFSANVFEVISHGLVRGCDIVALLKPQATIAVLLPETEVSGACTLLERLRTAIGDGYDRWHVKIFVYPENADEIAELQERAA